MHGQGATGYQAELAAQNIEVVPKFVRKTVQKQMEEIQVAAYQNVRTVVNQLHSEKYKAAPGQTMENVLKELKRIPEDVQVLASNELFGHTSKTSKEAAVQQIDNALAALPQVKGEASREATEVKSLVQRMPTVWEEMVEVARSAADQKVEEAMEQIINMPASVGNRAISYAFICAKMDRKEVVVPCHGTLKSGSIVERQGRMHTGLSNTDASSAEGTAGLEDWTDAMEYTEHKKTKTFFKRLSDGGLGGIVSPTLADTSKAPSNSPVGSGIVTGAKMGVRIMGSGPLAGSVPSPVFCAQPADNRVAATAAPYVLQPWGAPRGMQQGTLHGTPQGMQHGTSASSGYSPLLGKKAQAPPPPPPVEKRAAEKKAPAKVGAGQVKAKGYHGDLPVPKAPPGKASRAQQRPSQQQGSASSSHEPPPPSARVSQSLSDCEDEDDEFERPMPVAPPQPKGPPGLSPMPIIRIQDDPFLDSDARVRPRRSYSEDQKHFECSTGSFGHPETCTRPCLYYWRGLCRNAKSCRFCHLPHVKRPPRFDKRNRKVFEEMQLRQKINILHPVVVQKAAYLDCGPQMVAVFNQLLGMMQLDPPNAAQQPPVQRLGHQSSRRLIGILDNMTIRQLLQLFRRSLRRKASPLPQSDALERALDHMLHLANSTTVEPARKECRSQSLPPTRINPTM